MNAPSLKLKGFGSSVTGSATNSPWASRARSAGAMDRDGRSQRAQQNDRDGQPDSVMLTDRARGGGLRQTAR